MSDDVGSSAKGPIPTEQTEGPVVAGSMLEKMAAAIFEAMNTDDPWAQDIARAALEAIREPSPDVARAGMDGVRLRSPTATFKMMIDAILSETPPEQPNG